MSNLHHRIHHTGNGWFVETPTGPVGPLESSEEALNYLSLLDTVTAARTELVCSDKECCN